MTSRPECPRNDKDGDQRPWGRPNGHRDLKKLDRLLGHRSHGSGPCRPLRFRAQGPDDP